MAANFGHTSSQTYSPPLGAFANQVREKEPGFPSLVSYHDNLKFILLLPEIARPEKIDRVTFDFKHNGDEEFVVRFFTVMAFTLPQECGWPEWILNSPSNTTIDGSQAGEKFRYECDKGFKLEGHSEIVCNENSYWVSSDERPSLDDLVAMDMKAFPRCVRDASEC